MSTAIGYQRASMTHPRLSLVKDVDGSSWITWNALERNRHSWTALTMGCLHITVDTKMTLVSHVSNYAIAHALHASVCKILDVHTELYIL